MRIRVYPRVVFLPVTDPRAKLSARTRARGRELPPESAPVGSGIRGYPRPRAKLPSLVLTWLITTDVNGWENTLIVHALVFFLPGKGTGTEKADSTTRSI
jgi:hypothetical protein